MGLKSVTTWSSRWVKFKMLLISTCDQIQVLRHQFLESSRQLKEQMREAFDKDDRYCATGDEKYYLDLPGKENEKVVK